jgi:hypothetical protein
VSAPPVIAGRSRPTVSGWVVVLAVAGVLAVAALFWFDPGQYAFYPRCLFHATTGLHCPGCGALRGFHELLRGRWLMALHRNALVFGVAPLVGVGWVWRRWRKGEPMHLDHLRFDAASAGWWLGALLAFGVLRNIPLYPFTLLAP